MKLRIAFIALALFSSQASAEWELVTYDDEAITFLDPTTIRKQDNYTLAWTMTDYHDVKIDSNGKKFNSVKFLFVFKCQEMQIGMKSYVTYSDGLGKGDIVANANGQIYEVDFKDVVPASTGEATLKAVCKRH